jgi:hypothetical protein
MRRYYLQKVPVESVQPGSSLAIHQDGDYRLFQVECTQMSQRAGQPVMFKRVTANAAITVMPIIKCAPTCSKTRGGPVARRLFGDGGAVGAGALTFYACRSGHQSGRGGRDGRRVSRLAKNGHRRGRGVIADRRGDGLGVVTLGSHRVDHAPTAAERGVRTRSGKQVGCSSAKWPGKTFCRQRRTWSSERPPRRRYTFWWGRAILAAAGIHLIT